jgi:hypothetical protein
MLQEKGSKRRRAEVVSFNRRTGRHTIKFRTATRKASGSGKGGAGKGGAEGGPLPSGSLEMELAAAGVGVSGEGGAAGRGLETKELLLFSADPAEAREIGKQLEFYVCQDRNHLASLVYYDTFAFFTIAAGATYALHPLMFHTPPRALDEYTLSCTSPRVHTPSAFPLTPLPSLPSPSSQSSALSWPSTASRSLQY